jgi:24-hydroxycholesterol 7alpha-hydroxylase
MDKYMTECFDQDWGASGTANMFDKVVESMFWTSTKALFGERILSHKNSYNTFKELDANFEMAASGVFPEFMLGKFGESKAFLLGLLKAGKGDETVLSLYERVSEALLDRKEKSDPKLHHHWGLAALWASQANSLPSTFWTLMYVLTNPEIEKKVREEVDAVTEVYSKDQTMEENLNQFKYIRNCITEAIRIQSPGMIVRKVMRPMRLNSNKNVIVPSGHTLVISPYAIHRDPKVYDEPDKFIPERWEGKQNHIFVPFGKGAHECPGKAFSMSEMTLFIALLFKRYPTLKIEQPFEWPKADMKRLIGVAQPITPVTLRFSKN